MFVISLVNNQELTILGLLFSGNEENLYFYWPAVFSQSGY